MKTVLAPIDFSAASDGVVARAIALARATSARLVLLHVVTPVPVVGRAIALKARGAAFAARKAKGAARKLARLQRSLRDNGVTAHVLHLGGDPRECIGDQARRLAADYIVIGARGRRPAGDLPVGSTALGVLERAPCAVVIVPSGVRPAGRKRSVRTKSTGVLEV